MSKFKIVDVAVGTFHKTKLKLQKHSPEILLVVGAAGTVASAVMACIATTKVNDILTEARETVDAIHKIAEDPKKEYSKEDKNKALTITYMKTGLDLSKLYGPSLALGAASITCIFAAHSIIRKRNVALTAALSAITTDFKDYRGRVVERFGKELDRELRHNIVTREVEEAVINEDGTETKVKKTISVADPNRYSPYSIVFDDGNVGWDEDPSITKYFLVQQQNWANDKLKAQKHLFLNEVYDMLGVPRTTAGQIVGWVYDEEDPIGDNYVDFGIFDIYNPKARDFVNGYEKVIILDFNVDGPIHELIN